MDFTQNKLQDKVENIIGDTDLIKNSKSRDEEDKKAQLFEPIYQLICGAKELYKDGDMTWDAILTELTNAILKLQGKEKQLLSSIKEKASGNGPAAVDD